MAVEELNIIQAYKENRRLFRQLQKQGYIDIFLIRNMEIFLEFKRMREKDPEEPIMKLYYKLSIKNKLSDDMIRRIIAGFKID